MDEGIIRLQKQIGLNSDFFKNLLDEDDWSFVIKLHALIEALITSLLVFHFNEKKLSGIFSRIELSNKTTGKLAFMKELDLLSDEDIKFIFSLSELRNKFVHNIENCSVTLRDWIGQLDKNQIRNFAIYMRPSEALTRKIQDLGFGEKLDKLVIKQSDISNLIKFAKHNPKLYIWIGAYSLLVNIVDSYYYSDYLQSRKADELFNDDREIFQ